MRKPKPVRDDTQRQGLNHKMNVGVRTLLEELLCTAARRRTAMSEERQLRSRAWFGRSDKDGFIHRSWMRNQGFPATSSMAAGHRHLQYVV